MAPELFNHPNLSDSINTRIQEMQILGGVWAQDHPDYVNDEIKSQPVLPVGATLQVQTSNTLYTIRKTGKATFTIKGHPKFCPVEVPCNIHGSTWGGSMMRIGWIGRGMYLTFSTEQHHGVVTSKVEEITEI